jgi:Zn ribbon nucleic-acid-binding protein
MAKAMDPMNTCPICKNQSQVSNWQNKDGYIVDCLRCGIFAITRTAQVNLKSYSLTTREIGNISGFLRENLNYEIDSRNLDQLISLKTPSFNEKADKFLLVLDKNTFFAGEMLPIDDIWISYSWCMNEEEFKEVISYLEFTNRIYMSTENEESAIKIMPDGWQYLEEIKSVNVNSNQCFVAMWFSEEMLNIFNDAIYPGITNAGYRPHRVDLQEHNNKIDDEIISQIRRSKCVFADFTGHRGGVYFEAGFAKGLGLEVFWSCEENDIKNLHFDIRQFNCITWSKNSLKKFRDKITFRIESVIGQGKF